MPLSRRVSLHYLNQLLFDALQRKAPVICQQKIPALDLIQEEDQIRISKDF